MTSTPDREGLPDVHDRVLHPAPEANGEISRIRDQLWRACEGEAWHGPALVRLLENVTFQEAGRRLLPHRHTIWEIVLHVTLWLDVVARRLSGERVEVDDSAAWPPPPDETESGWQESLEDLQQKAASLDEALARMDDAVLWQPAENRDYPLYVMVHGCIQHLVYHAGQISLLTQPLDTDHT